MENQSGLHPTGRMVLVLLDQVPKAHGSIQLADSTIQKDEMAQVHATLVEVGPLAWEKEPKARVETGSRVVIKRFAGEYLTGLDKVKYRIINDNDIYAIRDFDLPN